MYFYYLPRSERAPPFDAGKSHQRTARAKHPHQCLAKLEEERQSLSVRSTKTGSLPLREGDRLRLRQSLAVRVLSSKLLVHLRSMAGVHEDSVVGITI
jgi:hypothetical protein